MNQGRDDCLQPVGKNFGDYFHGAIEVGNGSEIRDTRRATNFRYKSDEGRIDALETDIVTVKGPAQFIEINLYGWPAFLYEFITEPIWTSGFIIGELLNDVINFIS